MNRRSSVPQTDALTKLGHVPPVLSDGQMLAHLGHAWPRGTGSGLTAAQSFRSGLRSVAIDELVTGAAGNSEKALIRTYGRRPQVELDHRLTAGEAAGGPVGRGDTGLQSAPDPGSAPGTGVAGAAAGRGSRILARNTPPVSFNTREGFSRISRRVLRATGERKDACSAICGPINPMLPGGISG